MRTRRTLLALSAGTLCLAGCGAPGGGSDSGLAIETSDATAAPGETAWIEVQASSVGVMTWQLAEIPENWQVTHEGFEPEPTAVRESYPPELVWDPVAGSVTGTLAVAVPDGASPGEYVLAVEAGIDSTDERVISEATVTVAR
ncbi:hypothetical protein SAMN05443574_112101 [Haloarcula vallismortis]|uniref:Uncharacterized protein n=2 Tax=Haloarcula vallismortis TaxID=28442 RepID=M0IX77_HALVA|nr:hypothetical protein [Haloarcula vallismortis]EMA01457.1 hypothetical protein C437_17211 [Haloarcula vallismortis ATCC 29715]SDX03987.1 hypothetical protein SAMN05443574_112101 [Haloarcula vallismortis]